MKKITLILGLSVLILGAVSCKKDYTCDCNWEEAHDDHHDPMSTQYPITDMKKKDAEAACEAQAETLKLNPEHHDVSCVLK